jgi:CBS domain containing-hemolysin-like protein
MQEMACISFNRLRLEFFVKSGSKRALWIKNLLDKPTTLFGTTLIGVNIALVLSSESIRQCFFSLGYNPDLSPLIQAPYVAIFGELVPMFAARLFPEHMAKLGIPLLWVSSKVLAPITFTFDTAFRLLRKLLLSKSLQSSPPHLQRDELKDLVEERKKSYFDETTGQLETLVSRVFLLRDKQVSQLMLPLEHVPILTSTILCGTARKSFSKDTSETILVRNKQGRIVGYVTVWDVLTAPEATSLGSICRSPTFIGEDTSAIDVLFRLKKDQSKIALVIGSGGNVSGAITSDDLLSELARGAKRLELLSHIEKTISSDVMVNEFVERYRIIIPSPPKMTFAALSEQLLGHKPSLHDVIHFGPLEITIKEVGIRGAKTLVVKTVD